MSLDLGRLYGSQNFVFFDGLSTNYIYTISKTFNNDLRYIQVANLNGIVDKTPYFIQRKSVPIWMGIVGIFIIILVLFGKEYQLKDEGQALLTLSAELLVTILAVTMSFTLLGLQFLAEAYTPRSLAAYLRDKVVYGFPILYLILFKGDYRNHSNCR